MVVSSSCPYPSSAHGTASRRGHKKMRHIKKEQAPAVPTIEIQTVLRLRPLLKKERDDHIVIEPLLQNNVPSRSVALHPIPRPEVSASSQLVRQNFSPETVVTSHDLEFTTDHVFSSDTSQEKLYFSIGSPIALSSMDSLLKGSKKTHMIVITGSKNSGRSFSTFGPVSKRKHASDGLVPRILDSLFSQARHQMKHAAGNFAVNISIMQVHDEKSDECTLHDLLQPIKSGGTPRKRAATGFAHWSGTGNAKANAVKSLVANFERQQCATRATKTIPMRRSPARGYNSMKEPVFVEQDANTSDFQIINGQIKACYNTEEAREILIAATKRSEKMSKGHLLSSHVLVTMETSWMGKNETKFGGTIVVLDLAAPAFQDNTTSMPNHRRVKDSIQTRHDAYWAVRKCFETLQYNQTVASLMCCDGRQESLKKVPYRQHMLTMLLQRFFKGTTSITYMLTVYPGHTDYAEKKNLLQDLQILSTREPGQSAMTGLRSRRPSVESGGDQKPNNQLAPPLSMASHATNRGSQPVDRQILKKAILLTPMKEDMIEIPNIAKNPSLTYSDSTQEKIMDDGDERRFIDDEYLVPLPPPPIAPSFSARQLPQYILSPDASAPPEDGIEAGLAPSLVTTPRLATVPSTFDFAREPKYDLCTAEHSPRPAEPDSHQTDFVCAVEEHQSPTAHPDPSSLIANQPRSPIQELAQSVDRKHRNVFNSKSFRPVKTFNKVVLASKKKASQVIASLEQRPFVDPEVKVGPSNLSLSDTHAAPVDDREYILELERKNSMLVEENERLRARNEQLEIENKSIVSRGWDSVLSNDENIKPMDERRPPSITKPLAQKLSQLVQTKSSNTGSRSTDNPWNRHAKTAIPPVPYSTHNDAHGQHSPNFRSADLQRTEQNPRFRHISEMSSGKGSKPPPSKWIDGNKGSKSPSFVLNLQGGFHGGHPGAVVPGG
jgi:hypothetical protein